MNSRLLTPAIVLLSFGAALGLTRRHSGLWRAPAVDERVAAPLERLPPPLTTALTPPPPAAAAGDVKEPPPLVGSLQTGAQPVATPDAEAVAEDELPVVVTSEVQAQEGEGFFEARDRAAEHGARSH